MTLYRLVNAANWARNFSVLGGWRTTMICSMVAHLTSILTHRLRPVELEPSQRRKTDRSADLQEQKIGPTVISLVDASQVVDAGSDKPAGDAVGQDGEWD